MHLIQPGELFDTILRCQQFPLLILRNLSRAYLVDTFETFDRLRREQRFKQLLHSRSIHLDTMSMHPLTGLVKDHSRLCELWMLTQLDECSMGYEQDRAMHEWNVTK